MKSMSLKSTFRDIKSNFSRFLSIFAIVAIGVGFFAGVRASKPDMIDSADMYYNSQKLMDFSIESVDGFTDEDIKLIKEQVDSEVVESFVFDCVSTVNDSDCVIKLYSYSNKINVPQITEGRLPTSSNECIVDANSVSMPVKVGDVITIGKDYQSRLKGTEYKVVGLVDSAMYISGTQYGTTNLGNGQVDTVAFLNVDAFKGEPNALFVYCDFLRKYNCYTKEYENAVKDVIDRLDGVIKNRLNAILDGSYDYRKLNLSKYDATLSTSVNALYDNKERLDKEYNELLKNKEYLDKTEELIKQKSIGLQQTLEETEAYINGEVAKYDALMSNVLKLQSESEKAQSDYESTKNQYDNKVTLIDEKRAALAEITDVESDEYKNAQKEIDTLQAEIDVLKKSVEQKEALFKQKSEAHKKALSEYDSAYASADKTFSELNGNNSVTAEELVQMTIAYRSAQIEYNARINMYDQARSQLDEALATVVESVSSIYSNFDNLWYFSDRTALPGNAEYNENAERIGNISKVFPAFFLLVAMLVCLTTMTRLVSDQRTQIGVLKALGYSNASIAMKYIIYAMLATLLGCGVGLSIGFVLYPRAILFTYSMLYTINCAYTPFRVDIACGSSAIMCICILLTVIAACSGVVTNNPSKLMRPKAPPAGKRILLDRVKFLWNKLSFTQKVIARNMFIHKKRKIMTIVGIAGCTALLLTGFGLRDSVSDIIDKQFERIWNYDATAYYSDAELAEDEIKAAKTDSWLLCYQKSQKVKAGSESQEAYLTVAQDDSLVKNFITLSNRTTDELYSLEDSDCLVTEKLAKLLKVSKGDRIELNLNGKFYRVRIDGVVENYAYHYVYLSNSCYKELAKCEPEYNTALINYDGNETKYAEKLLKSGDVMGVRFNSDTESAFKDIIRVLNIVILVLLISAAALSFVVLYNLTDINITERTREIATLKVLGFTKKEMYKYIFKENTILSLFGTALGIGVGYLLAMYVINTAEIDMVMFGRDIYWPSYLFSVILTIVFTLTVNLIMRPKLNKIDMVESLKTVE